MVIIVYFLTIEKETKPDAATDSVVESNVESKNLDIFGKQICCIDYFIKCLWFKTPFIILLQVLYLLINTFF